MQLAYISPVSLETLAPFMIIEAVLIVLNIVLFVFYLYMLLKIRFHINLKVRKSPMGDVTFQIIVFIDVAQYFPSLFTRLVTIAYQMKLIPVNGKPETTPLLIISTFFRFYHFGVCLSLYELETSRINLRFSSIFLLIERHLAMIYIHDYEKKPRIWIAVVLPIAWTTYSGTFVAAYIYGKFIE